LQDKAVAAAQKYLELADTRYKGGVTSYLEVTTAQSAALSDEVTAGKYSRPAHGQRRYARASAWWWVGSSLLAGTP